MDEEWSMGFSLGRHRKKRVPVKACKQRWLRVIPKASYS